MIFDISFSLKTRLTTNVGCEQCCYSLPNVLFFSVKSERFFLKIKNRNFYLKWKFDCFQFEMKKIELKRSDQMNTFRLLFQCEIQSFSDKHQYYFLE